MATSKKQNLKRILNLASTILKINGVFLEGKRTSTSFIAAASGLFFSGSFLLFCVIALFAYWEDIESIYRSEGIPLSLKDFVCLMIVLYQTKEWGTLVKKVAALDLYEKLEENDRKDMDANINFYIIFSIAYTVQTVLSVFIFYLKPIISMKLPLDMYTFCDLKILECYVPYIIYEILMEVFMLSFPLGLNLLYIYMVLAMICQIEAIKCSLRKIGVNTKMHELGVIIEQHDQVSLIMDEFRSTAKHVFLVIYMTSMLSVCVVFYMINRNGFPPDKDVLTRYLPIILLFTMEIYIFAFGASQLSESIYSVAEEVYGSNWPEITDLSVRKSLILMVQKSQNTQRLMIGGWILLDLPVFIDVMQNAFSFYTLMANLGKE